MSIYAVKILACTWADADDYDCDVVSLAVSLIELYSPFPSSAGEEEDEDDEEEDANVVIFLFLSVVYNDCNMAYYINGGGLKLSPKYGM